MIGYEDNALMTPEEAGLSIAMFGRFSLMGICLVEEEEEEDSSTLAIMQALGEEMDTI